MSVHAYELTVDGDDIDERWHNEASEQLGRVTNTGLYPYNKTLQVPIDLSAVPVDEVYLLHASRAMTLYKFIITYIEAPSGDAGITLELGKETDRDYYYTGTSDAGEAQWFERDCTLLQTDVAAGDTVRFYSPNNKVGTGEIIVTIEYGFTPT